MSVRSAWPPHRTVQSGAHARDHGLVIVTKDENFHRLSVLLGPPPKVMWVRLGNCSTRSEEHTSELQSRLHLVCRLLLEKKKKKKEGTVRQHKKRQTY